jgi:hypothetical protein
MKIAFGLLCLLCGIAVTTHAAQLYRWVDKDGKVEWRDTPPPTSVPAKNVEQRRLGDNVISTSELPFATQHAMKTNPVTLWANDCGDACNQARAHLARRGVPYLSKFSSQD